MNTNTFRNILILFLGLVSINLFINCGGEKPQPFEFKDKDKVIAKFEKPFIFKKGTGELTNPEDFNDLANLKDYLANYEKKIILNGLYAPNDDDGNASVGTARAQAVKNLLNKFGVENSFIQVGTKASDNLLIKKDLVYNPLDYAFQVKVDEKDEFNRRFESSKFTYNYAIMQSYCKLNDDLKKYLTDLKTYLQNNPNASLMIDGHADITGTKQLNMRLSKDRSRKLKNLLVKNGIDAKMIKTKGYGYDKPIATNSTKAGRAQNRRSEIMVAK